MCSSDLENFSKASQARIRQFNQADIGLNGGERVIRSQDVRTGQGIKQSGLANVGQTDNSKCKTHADNPNAHQCGCGRMGGL